MAMKKKVKEKPPCPDRACGICKEKAWWWREPSIIYGVAHSPGAWLCGRCHPNPNREKNNGRRLKV